MIRRRFYLTCLLFFFVSGCQPQKPTYKTPFKTPSNEEGQILLYLQPTPQEANKLRFILNGISAVRSDGSKIPLSLSLEELKGAELTGRQKLMASRVLPPGTYTGVSITVDKAFVQSEEGEIALFIPEEPVTASRLFEVKRREALTLFLTLHASGAITDGMSFTPVFSLATSSRGLINLSGYVSNSDSNLISVFNKKTMQVVNAISTGREPKGLALDQRRARAYVAVSGDDVIEVFDVLAGRMIGRIRLSFADEPIDLALTPDGRTLVSVNHSSNTVSIIDAISMLEITKIRVGEGPHSAVIDHSGFKAYVFNSGSSTVSVVDLTQRAPVATIGVDGAPLRGAFNRAGDRLYVINRESPNLTVVDPARFVVTNRIFVGMGAASIAVDLSTGLILVGKKFGGEISIIDPFSSMFIDTIKVRGSVAFLTIDRQENTLFVALPDRKLLQKVNFTSKEIIAEIDVGEGAYSAAVMGER